ncbi:Stp1/IreP family PP2C-type Ser/Thr phosphatase [Natranaerobius trueperi]|uniref:Serine/threonine protein phosphatase n=1 Tax=Natranaerobius trueperi TaxID=759412 RepID=A0A226C147_9FIRM|nr:Stp1/IreP family PP2C-type Ser/Thr phosphatase [Natranaerobius trueperi]OWZ84169.1 serine/threonine protein phosphatase [Natranaerobius trueperi]
MRHYSITDVGITREKNEDKYLDGIKVGEIFIIGVADGMGGHRGGNIASNIAVSTIKDFMLKNQELTNQNIAMLPKIAKEAVEKANEEINKYKQQYNDFYHMGTTITVGFIYKDDVVIAHVGDSRAYLINRKDKIVQLTEDHSLVNQLFQKGKITSEGAANHPQKNILTRALGTHDVISIDIQKCSFPPESVMLFCTDGLTHYVGDDEIYQTLSNSEDLKEGCKKLVELANERGGHDNITISVVASDNLAGIFKR